MVRSIQLALASLLVLVGASALQAQVSCPSDNRLVITKANGKAFPTTDGASHDILLGRAPDHANPLVLAAFVKVAGGCYEPAFVSVGTSLAHKVRLTADTNLCLGSGADRVSVLTVNTNVRHCSGVYPVAPFAYGGFRLRIHGGSGNDELRGGSGKDWIYGGNGADHLVGGSGDGDELRGEGGGDTLDGSTGKQTVCEGGPDNDGIHDGQGEDDWLDGGSGNDFVGSTCNSTYLFCGSGSDWAVSPDPKPITDFECERWDDLSC
jgi:hypothetical protein